MKNLFLNRRQLSLSHNPLKEQTCTNEQEQLDHRPGVYLVKPRYNVPKDFTIKLSVSVGR